MTREILEINKMLRNGHASHQDVLLLQKCLHNKQFMKSAAHAVGSLKIKALLDGLFEIAEQYFDITITFAIVQFGEEVIHSITKKLDNGDSIFFKSNAALVLGYFPHEKSALEALLKLAKDASPQVRRITVYALGYFNNDRSKNVLKKISANDSSKLVRTFARKSLQKIKKN